MIDRRKTYVMVLDTETCNGITGDDGSVDLDYSIVYDGGFSIVDTKGNVYEEHSYVMGDVFCGMKDLMKSAYYAEKIPDYWNDIKAKTRTMISFNHFRNIVWDKIREYNITAIVAHNARFDIRALNNTCRYLTKSKVRWFFPRGTEVWDSLMMARSVIGVMPTYQRFCEDNGYMTAHAVPQCRFTAEVLYRFITKDTTFEESHTALEDVKIEREIMWYCYRQKQPMKKILYARR